MRNRRFIFAIFAIIVLAIFIGAYMRAWNNWGPVGASNVALVFLILSLGIWSAFAQSIRGIMAFSASMLLFGILWYLASEVGSDTARALVALIPAFAVAMLGVEAPREMTLG